METKQEGNPVEDLMFLFGFQKNKRQYAKWIGIEIEAENAWYEGKDADANPYNSKTHQLEHSVWYSQWLKCNKNC